MVLEIYNRNINIVNIYSKRSRITLLDHNLVNNSIQMNKNLNQIIYYAYISNKKKQKKSKYFDKILRQVILFIGTGVIFYWLPAPLKVFTSDLMFIDFKKKLFEKLNKKYEGKKKVFLNPYLILTFSVLVSTISVSFFIKKVYLAFYLKLRL